MAYIKKGDLLHVGITPDRTMIAASDDYTKRMSGTTDYENFRSYENDWHFVGAVDVLDPATGKIYWWLTSDVKKVS